jgi:hypothetical protein
MSAAWPILLALFTLAPSLPSPTGSQLTPILTPIRFLSSFLSSTPISYDLLASLLVVPTYFTLAHRTASGWSKSYTTSIFLILFNTYISLRTLLHPPSNIFANIPFSTRPEDLLVLYPPGKSDPRMDELITRLSNSDTRIEYIRYGHETMLNTPTLTSPTIIYATYIALQLPAYILTASVLAIMTSLPSPPPTSP